jgi:hypothetical protein
VLLLSACETNIDLIDCQGNQEVLGICVDVTPPVIEGATDVTLFQNALFDPREGVTAIDDQSGDLTDNVQISGSVDTSEIGLYLLTYEVQDEFSNETIVLRYIDIIPDPANIGDNIVTNGDFNDGFNGYGTYMAENGFGIFTVVDGVLEIDVTKVGNSIPWEPRLDYQQLVYEQHITYRVSFDIKADNERLFEVLIGELIPYEPWFISYSPSHQTRRLATTEWTTHEFEFTMSSSTTYNGCILFHFGAMGTSENLLTMFYLDNVVIQPLN